MPPSSTRKHTAQPHKASPLLSSRDFERHLLAKAADVAPSDVTALVARADEIRAQAADEQAVHATLAHHVRLALHLLSDHTHGACPQIPYYTVSLLTAALHYYIEPFDVIPDFIPRVGKADDAYMFELAWRRGRPGIERYVAWKGLAESEVSTPVPAIVMPSSKTPDPSTSVSRRAPARGAVRHKRKRR